MIINILVNVIIKLLFTLFYRMDDVINTTTAKCRTTSSSVGSSHQLNVIFDELTEKQTEGVFTYRPNPTVSDVQPLKTILRYMLESVKFSPLLGAFDFEIVWNM